MNVPVIPVLMVELVKMQQILTYVVAPQDLLETDVKQTFTPVMVKYVRTMEHSILKSIHSTVSVLMGSLDRDVK